MKVSNKKSAISQTIDLFFLVAGVLAIGGIVIYAIYTLGTSATSNSSLVITSATVHPGAAASVTATIAVKNDASSALSGTPTITVAGGSCTVSGTSALAPGATEVLSLTACATAVTAGQANVAVAVTWGSATGTVSVTAAQS
ncbi:MAG: hypothetical protein JRN62_04160 [Nitrososphaerota archaeon]|jgi:hypothetical protein|nr:hypothetical protein [Nitrososphaerota archaeon]MDG6948797.1 hypothetical protein [Nitrososphaerota archaeon]